MIRSLIARHGKAFTIVHGDAPGVDTAFRTACRRLGCTHEPHPAAWETYGNAAGPIRNTEMIASGVDYAIAVHRNLSRSRGTRDCVRQCLDAEVPVYLIDGVNPDRKLTSV